MAGLHFEFTANNSTFLKKVDEIQSSVETASKVLDNLNKNFDLSSTENKILALGKVIKTNETSIISLTTLLKKWAVEANEAYNANNTSTFEAITADIEEQKNNLKELVEETQAYYSVLQSIQQDSSASMSLTPVASPLFFTSQVDYDYVENLRDKIEALQNQISQFDGSEEELQVLRTKLSSLQAILYSCESEAAEAASKLGKDLGGKAAETSTKLFELNNAIQQQEQVLSTLQSALSDASSKYEELKNSEDVSLLEEARIKYELLASSVRNAENELYNLQAAQKDAQTDFQQLNGEINQQNSVMVKLLGGYENYQSIISNFPKPIQSVIGGLNGMTGAAKAFIATPLGAIIAAIVLSLQALKTWFDSSVEGQKVFAEISGYVTGVLDQLKEIVIMVGKAIYNAFKDPQKAVEDLWKAIKTNIVNRFKSVGEMAKSMGALMKAALTFNTDAIQKEFKNLTNSFLKFGTGVDDVTGKVANYVKGVNEAAKANARLSREEREIEIAESEEKKNTAERNKRMRELQGEMYDTQDKKKQKAALEEYKKLSEEQMNSELALQDRRIALQKERMSLTTNAIEDENKLRDLETERMEIEAANAGRLAMLQRRSNSINKSSGKTSEQLLSDQQKAHQKLISLLKQQSEERSKQLQEQEFEIWQKRIDLMDEGEAKVLAQMALNNQKEKIALEEQKKQAINDEIARQKAIFDAREDELAAGNKKYAKKVFNPETDVDQAEIDKIIKYYSVLQSQLTDLQAKAEQDRLDKAKEDMNNYLKEYGNYQQKVNAIKAQYQNEIDSATTSGARMQAIANRDKELANLDFEEWIGTGDLALAFGDISKLSRETIQSLIANMELYRSKVIATFDPDKIQKFENALTNLRSADTDFDFIFSADNDIVSALKERLSLQRQITENEANQIELINQRKAIELELNTLKMQGITPDMQMDENGTYGEGISEESVIRAQELQSKLNGIDTSFKQSVQNAKVLNDQLQATKSVKFADVQKFANNLLMAGKNAAELASVFGDEVSDGIGTAIDMIGGLFSAFDTLSSNIEALSKTATDVVSKTANAAEGIVEASSQGMKTSAAATATSLSTMEKASAILAIIGAAIQLATMVASLFNSDKKHEKNIATLQDRIDALQKSYDKLGKSINNAYSSDASKLIEQQNTLLKQQKVLIQQQMAEEQAKKKTDDDKIKEYKERIEEINELIEDNKKKAIDAIFGEDLNSAIERFADAYADAWENGEDKAESAKDTVKKMMQQMVKESIKAAVQSSGKMEEIRNKLQQFYKDEVLSGWEQEYIYNMAEQLQKEIDEKFSWADSLLSGDQEREGTSKGITTASQDSVDEMNARLTTIQGHTYILSQNSDAMVFNTSQILNYLVSIEMLQHGFNDIFKSMDKRLQLVASDISTMTTRGVKLL